MTPDKLLALRAFFVSIEARLPGMVDAVYGRLFELQPDAKSLFKGNLQEQKLHFVHMLQSMVILTRSSHLWPVGGLTGQASIPALEHLGYLHAKAGVTRAHFAKMQIVLLQVCQETAPMEFTPRVAEALAFILDVLARSTAVPHDQAPDALAQLLSRNTGTALQDPSSYFDEELPGVNAVQEPLVERI